MVRHHRSRFLSNSRAESNQFSLFFLGSCGNCTSAPTVSPSAAVTSAPTAFPAECKDIIYCGVDESNIRYCIELRPGVRFELCLPLSYAPFLVPQYGTCGECPVATLSPTEVPAPSISPTLAPSLAPTGALDGCILQPPPCNITDGGDEDRVTFCFELGGGAQIELCILSENISKFLDRGKLLKLFVPIPLH